MAGLELVDTTHGEPCREPGVCAETGRDCAICTPEVANALDDPFGPHVGSPCTRADKVCFDADDPGLVDA